MAHCADAHHHHSADDLLRHADERCETLGVRLTPLRRRVLEMLANSEKPIKAYDLLDVLKKEHDAAAPPTIYRALDFLLEHGFVHKIESLNAFVACPHAHAGHPSQFLICDQCGATVELEDQEISTRLFAQARLHGFVPSHNVTEVHGRCPQCQISTNNVSAVVATTQ
jgi:Fur family transcriptional regulator, zinc uptake regulator